MAEPVDGFAKLMDEDAFCAWVSDRGYWTWDEVREAVEYAEAHGHVAPNARDDGG